MQGPDDELFSAARQARGFGGFWDFASIAREKPLRASAQKTVFHLDSAALGIIWQSDFGNADVQSIESDGQYGPVSTVCECRGAKYTSRLICLVRDT